MDPPRDRGPVVVRGGSRERCGRPRSTLPSSPGAAWLALTPGKRARGPPLPPRRPQAQVVEPRAHKPQTRSSFGIQDEQVPRAEEIREEALAPELDGVRDEVGELARELGTLAQEAEQSRVLHADRIQRVRDPLLEGGQAGVASQRAVQDEELRGQD